MPVSDSLAAEDAYFRRQRSYPFRKAAPYRAPTVPIPLATVLRTIPDDCIALGSGNRAEGTDAHGMPSFWLIFAAPEDRTQFLSLWRNRWILMPDRCARLDYALDWKDVSGYGLQLTTSTC